MPAAKKTAKRVAKKTATPRATQRPQRQARRAPSEVQTGGNYFANPKTDLDFFGSGCTTLDLAMGGGWCRGRIGNIIGDAATGKTLLAIEACANFNISLPRAKIRYRETERAFDDGYAAALGFPVDKVDRGGQELETVEDLFNDLERIAAGARGPELVVVDSLDSLSDSAELKRAITEGTYGAKKAQLMSQLFRRLNAKLSRADVTVLFVSQVRDNISAFGPAQKWSVSGGKALHFYSSQRIILANAGRLKKTYLGQERAIGLKILAKMYKNKVGLPYREAAFQIRFSYGIDDAQACVDFLDVTNRLKEVDILKDEVKGFLNYLLKQPRDEAAAEMERIREAVKRTWYEIEAKTVTSRSKYGDD